MPAFLKPIPTSLEPNDICYLTLNGGLDIPSPVFQNALVNAYIEFVHPYLPVIDLINFIDIPSHPDGSNRQISLTLYQAVMFAGFGFVEMKVL